MSQKFIYLFLFIFFNIFCFSQKEKQITKIDSLLKISDMYINIDFEKSLIFADKALIEAKKQNNSNGRAQADYYAAKSLIFFRQFEKGSQYIEKGLQEDALKKNIQLKALFLILQHTYYTF